MKGIILAGGKGTRLAPMTNVISKQLLPIYDKPMIYYPMSVLMLAGIREILIISTPKDLPMFEELFGDGSKLGLKIEYAEQAKPNGLAESLIIGEEFIGKDPVCLILGDNLFFGDKFQALLEETIQNNRGATVFGYPVDNPKDFGIVEFDSKNRVVSVEEKPKEPKSNYAIPGIYFYDNNAAKTAKTIEPSARGELEITSVNEAYLKKKKLDVVLLGRGFTWLDTGNAASMIEAGKFVEIIQKRQGYYIACLEEIAWRKGFIDDEQLKKLANSMRGTDYGRYLLRLKE